MRRALKRPNSPNSKQTFKFFFETEKRGCQHENNTLHMLKYSYKAQGSNSTLRTPNGHLKRQHANCSKSFIPSKIRKLLLLHTTNMLNYLHTLQELQRNTPTPDESSQRQNATISSAQGSNSTLTLKEAYPQVLTLFLSSNKSTRIIIHINKVTKTRISTFELIHFIYTQFENQFIFFKFNHSNMIYLVILS